MDGNGKKSLINNINKEVIAKSATNRYCACVCMHNGLECNSLQFFQFYRKNVYG